MGLKPFDVFQLPTVEVHKLVEKQNTQVMMLLAKHGRRLYSATNKFIINQILGKQYLTPKNFLRCKSASTHTFTFSFYFILFVYIWESQITWQEIKVLGTITFSSHVRFFSDCLGEKKIISPSLK